VAVPTLSVRTEDGRAFRFSRSFRIGRDHDCDLRLEDAEVSRQHVLVSFGNGHWELHDQQSGNGVYVKGRRVETASIGDSLTIRLGADGPRLVMEVEPFLPTKGPPSVAQRPVGETMLLASYVERYFGTTTDQEPVGGRTLMIRKAFHRVHKKQARIYRGVVAVVALAALGAGGYAYYGHRQMLKQQAVAEELFYSMKSLDVEIANVERLVAATSRPQGQDQVKRYQERRRQMESDYEQQFLSGLKLYDHTLTRQEQLILRVTRIFGECELAAPPEYLAEVGTYVRRWQGTGRYAMAVNRAQEMGYTKRIAEEFEKQDLPPQFFYLAMVESGFDEVASGPLTRMGYAKGMWQFIPDTARRYGLSIDTNGRRQPARPPAISRISTRPTPRPRVCWSWRPITGARIESSTCCGPCRPIPSSATSGRCSSGTATRFPR
jgi:membrane-bound lytic murein transglycosylase D